MKNLIYDQARRCRTRFGTSDPYQLLDAVGAVLVFSDAYPPDGLRGYCTVLNRISYVVINRRQPEEEQRVVAAHEAGHLILHREQLRSGAAMQDFDVYNVKSRLERQANFFAADFLIDDDEVLDLMHSGDADFFDVARSLRIPAPFFAFKLYSMVDRGYAMRMPVDLDSTFLK